MNEKIKRISREDLSNNLSAMTIHQFTSIPLSTVYALINKTPDNGGFQTFRIGKSIYTEREVFLEWWDRTTGRNLELNERVVSIGKRQ